MRTRIARIARVGSVAAFAVASLGSLLPAAARGQEPRPLAQPTDIPADLASALIAAGGFGGQPQILVGSMPGWVNGKLFLPRDARVLGSAFRGTTVVAVVNLPGVSDSILSGVKRGSATLGWKAPPPTPVVPGGGFRSAPPPIVQGQSNRAILCGDQQILSVTAETQHGISTTLTYRLVGTTGFSQCRPPEMPTSFIRSPFPTLYNPPTAGDARLTGDCSSTLMGANSTSTTIRTPMTIEALLDHYSRQLSDSGWTSASEKPLLIGRSFTRTDAFGAPVEATLTIGTSSRDASCHDAVLQVRTLRKP